jgi:hypothetical protein
MKTVKQILVATLFFLAGMANSPLTGINASGNAPKVPPASLTSGQDYSTTLGMAKRCTGPFDYSPDSIRPMFQTYTANANTWVGALPTGTATLAGFVSYNGSDPDNASAVRTYVNGSNGARVESFKNGTGTLQKLVVGQTGAETVLRTSLTTPASVSDGDWWVECTGTSPSRVCAIKVRDAGTTRTIASLTF